MYILENDGVLINNNKKYFTFFDFEVFPNYWLIVMRNNKGTHVIKCDEVDARQRILDNTLQYIMVGFNIKKYDLVILNAVLKGFSAQEIYKISNDIIRKENAVTYDYWNKFSFIDLFDDNMTSLKEFEANNKMSIVESSVDFTKEDLTKSEIEEIVEYCIHDVDATAQMFLKRFEYVNSKVNLANEFNINIIDALKATNAKLAERVFNPFPCDLKNDLPFVVPENLKDYFNKWIEPELLNVYTSNNIVNIDKFEWKAFDNNIVFGLGGIHSTIGDCIYAESSDTETLWNIDVTSYYPNLVIHYDYMSRKASNKDLYKNIYEKRVYAKRNGNDAVSDALKLVLNTTYGAMKNEYNKLYDPYQACNVCVLGQLCLYALAKEIYETTNSKIIQNNTDGICLLIKNENYDKVKSIVSNWETLTKFNMEWDKMAKFIQRDVNNYIEVKDGYEEFTTTTGFRQNLDKSELKALSKKVKLKGKWANQAFGVGSGNNLNAPITHLAIVNYYVCRVPYEYTIKQCSDIEKFIFTSKTGKTYDHTYHFINDKPEIVNKVNRTLATNKAEYGTIKKFKLTSNEDGTMTHRWDKQAEISDKVIIINDEYTKYRFQDLDLDYNFYLDFTRDKLVKLKKITFK